MNVYRNSLTLKAQETVQKREAMSLEATPMKSHQHDYLNLD